MLSGCATSGFSKPSYPVLPADLRICFDDVVPAPRGELTKAQIMKLIASFKTSETVKTDCGKRLIGFYDSLST